MPRLFVREFVSSFLDLKDEVCEGRIHEIDHCQAVDLLVLAEHTAP
jgi:hypothetical protein